MTNFLTRSFLGVEYFHAVCLNIGLLQQKPLISYILLIYVTRIPKNGFMYSVTTLLKRGVRMDTI